MDENTLELLAQTGLHLFLVHENAVFGQASGFDITVDQQDTVSCFRQFPCAVNTGGPGADHRNQVLL
jgi:hypothetical protein